jgi:hypothetical protein
MEIELLPTVSLLPETFSVLIAPVELLARALNSHLELQRYKILFICGNTPASSAGWTATPPWKCAAPLLSFCS